MSCLSFFKIIFNISGNKFFSSHLCFLKRFFFSFLNWCFAHMYACVRMLDPGVTDSFKLPCGLWKLNLGPQEEQSVLVMAEPSLQPLFT